MRIYQSCREMYDETKRDLHEMGTRVHPGTFQDRDVRDDPGYETLEISPYGFQIVDGSDRDEWIKDLGLNLDWCHFEMQDRMLSLLNDVEFGQLNPGEAWKLRADVWEPFIHHGRFAYTYAERFSFTGALKRVMEILKRLPNTRHGILPVFNVEDLRFIGGRKRVPCSMYYQFIVRTPDGLRCIYTMRSSDFLTHFPYDIWLALELQSLIAKAIDQPVGHFTFFTGSLHIYARDAEEGVF